MTTDTIKEVLGKIMSINKNLKVDSLESLLVASGWDKQDIEEGLEIFKYYTGKNPTQTHTQIIEKKQEEPIASDLNLEESQNTIDSKVSKVEKEQVIEVNGSLGGIPKIDIDEIIKEEELKNSDLLDQQKIDQAKIEEENNNKNLELSKDAIVEPILESEPKLITENNEPDSFAIFLIILNSIIGILFFLFILYIILM